ncbi:hypothetical protein R1flu_007784 [Riccia fluitans]|uniref:Uncharacterized protein n=1 Tax=Riccia fluitans TaxID=41844 RepID=A0ABD1YZU1_9MARC
MHYNLRRCIGLGAVRNEHTLLEIREAVYEIEDALFSIGEPAISEAVLALYPNGYPSERPIPEQSIPSTPEPSPPREELSRQDLYDHLEVLEVEELCDIYQELLEESCECDDIELEDVIFEVEQLLFSTRDEVIKDAILEHYPGGYTAKQPIRHIEPRPIIQSPRIRGLYQRLGVWAA